MSINVSGVSKRFGDFVALDNVSVDLPTGQLTALLGPSGGGKSTLLRIIAGLESADDGTVTIEGNEATHLPPQKRNVGFVFQHYAAFKHMSVAKNVAFGLEIRKRPKDEVKRRVDELLELVHLSQFAHRLPSQLSGGQRQRMALARALAVEPSVLLLDEPFGALDAKVRKELRDWLRRLHDEVHVTTVFVTHDQEEALEVADRVVVLDKGRVQQSGTPEQVYEQPVSAFVHEFIGETVTLPVAIDAGAVHFGSRRLDLDPQGLPDGRARLFIRPDEVSLVAAGAGALLEGTVRRVQGLGGARRVEIALREQDGADELVIEVDAPRQQRFAFGEQVGLCAHNYRIFADQP